MKVIKKIISIIIIAIIVYAIFLLLSDIDKITDKIINFKSEFILIIVPLPFSPRPVIHFLKRTPNVPWMNLYKDSTK